MHPVRDGDNLHGADASRQGCRHGELPICPPARCCIGIARRPSGGGMPTLDLLCSELLVRYTRSPVGDPTSAARTVIAQRYLDAAAVFCGT